MPRAASAAMRLNLSQSSSHAPDSPEMSESEPFLASYSRATSPSVWTPPNRRTANIGLGFDSSRASSPSPLGVRHFSSSSSVPNSPALPPYSPSPTQGAFFDGPGAAAPAVAAVTRGRRFRLAALSAVGIIAIVGFASMGAADPDRLQRHVVEPVRDAWHAASEAAEQSYDQVKGWTGWHAPPASPDDGGWAHEGNGPVMIPVDEDGAEPAAKVEHEQVDVVIEPSSEQDQAATPEANGEDSHQSNDAPVKQADEEDQAHVVAPVPLPTPVESSSSSAFIGSSSSASSEEPVSIALPTSYPVIDTEAETDVAVEAEPTTHPVYVLPDPPRMPKGGPEEKFFAYLPHSGFHNQRIELANAMTLARMLNRTLLVPPVWIGWPITTLAYKPLQAEWDRQMGLHPEAFTFREEPTSDLTKRQAAPNAKARPAQPSRPKGGKAAAKPKKAPAPPKPSKKVMTEEECKSYAKECKSTYQDTFVAWSFLADIELAALRVPLVDRFNMSEAYMAEITGATPEQIYTLDDSAKYWYQFFDTDHHDEPMIQQMDFEKTKFHYRVSIPKLAQGTKDYKLITMGSTFGSTRLMLEKKVNSRSLNAFHRSLAFRNPLLDTPANRIRDLMGGPGRYVGVHARVGDGQFKLNSMEYMKRTFEELVVDKLGVDKSLLPALLEAAAARVKTLPVPPTRRSLDLEERSKWADVDSPFDPEALVLHLPAAPADRRQRRQAGSRLAVSDRASSPLADTLVCRGELHADPALFALNAPLYIATDASHPLEDPALAYFFANFPCAFVLADFDKPSEFNKGPPVTSLKAMEMAVNVNDGVKLGRLLLPFMEAAVAAKSGAISGTNGSTFSAFAAGALHHAYADDQTMNDE